jgi:hypothetical protein
LSRYGLVGVRLSRQRYMCRVRYRAYAGRASLGAAVRYTVRILPILRNLEPRVFLPARFCAKNARR